jgi:hypothetical protein
VVGGKQPVATLASQRAHRGVEPTSQHGGAGQDRGHPRLGM